MKKTFIIPSLEVKEFNRNSVVTLSGEGTNPEPSVTNEKKAVDYMGETKYVKITL